MKYCDIRTVGELKDVLNHFDDDELIKIGVAFSRYNIGEVSFIKDDPYHIPCVCIQVEDD